MCFRVAALYFGCVLNQKAWKHICVNNTRAVETQCLVVFLECFRYWIGPDCCAHMYYEGRRHKPHTCVFCVVFCVRDFSVPADFLRLAGLRKVPPFASREEFTCILSVSKTLQTNKLHPVPQKLGNCYLR